jgi:hypothetical protein
MERSRIVEIIDIRGCEVTITLVESDDGTWSTGVAVDGSTVTTMPQEVASKKARDYALGVASEIIGAQT